MDTEPERRSLTGMLQRFFNVERRELGFTVEMFLYFFLVISTFWILKPIKKSLFIEYYDQTGFDLLSWHLSAPQAELIAKVANMFVAIGAVVVFSWLASRYRRQQLTYVFSAFAVLMLVLYSFLTRNPQDGTVWTFYLFGDLYNTLMVPTFFAFLNDSVTPSSAKRLYGAVGLGGVTGGVFGSSFVSAWLDRVSTSEWMWICVAITVAIVGVAYLAGSWVAANPPAPQAADVEPAPAKTEDAAGSAKANPAIDGAKLVMRSRYLLAIVAIVGLYELASTILDFMFTSTITHYLDGDAIGRQFSTVFTITNWVSMLVQLLLTSLVMRKLGLGVALLILPVAVFGGAAAFAVFPVLWVGSLLNTADNGFSYSINQSAREALYVPTTREEKYKAKAFIDMFVQRFAKAVAVGLSLLITTTFTDFGSMRWLSLVVAVIVVFWIFAVRYAGKRFQELETK